MVVAGDWDLEGIWCGVVFGNYINLVTVSELLLLSSFYKERNGVSEQLAQNHAAHENMVFL